MFSDIIYLASNEGSVDEPGKSGNWFYDIKKQVGTLYEPFGVKGLVAVTMTGPPENLLFAKLEAVWTTKDETQHLGTVWHASTGDKYIKGFYTGPTETSDGIMLTYLSDTTHNYKLYLSDGYLVKGEILKEFLNQQFKIHQSWNELFMDINFTRTKETTRSLD